MENNVENIPPPNVHRNYRLQRYRVEWENMPEYQFWIQRVHGDDLRARCRVCNREFLCRSIRTHAASAIYQRAMGLNNDDDRNEIINRKVNIAIIKLCAVFAEHNLAFLLANHLIPVIKDISADEDCEEI